MSTKPGQLHWGRIVQNAVNLWNETSGTPYRMYFAGYGSGSGDITIKADMTTCDTSSAHATTSVNSFDWDEIDSATVYLHSKKFVPAYCETMLWDPLLPSDSVTWKKDPVNLLMHEIGHTVGLDHPFEICGYSVAAVMNHNVPHSARHYTRHDRQDYGAHLGYQQGDGWTWTLQPDTDTWASAGTWPITAHKRLRPGTPSRDGLDIVLAWRYFTNYTRRASNRSTDATSWIYETTLSDGETWDPDAIVAAGASGTLRHYFLHEPSTSSNNKQVCFHESSDYGATWTSTKSCLPISTQRTGISVEYDDFRKAYIIIINANCTGENNTNCNRLQGYVQPGPGSSIPTDKMWPLFGHHSFNVPTIACRRASSAADRCLIAFSSADLYPFLRWVEGGIDGNGNWVQTADRADTSIRVDHAPSAAFYSGDNRFHLNRIS